MIPPDQEIYEVEKRIAERRGRVERAFRETGRQAVRALTSPWALGAAAVLGFFVAGGMRLRHRREAAMAQATRPASKTGAVSSLAMAALTWFIKSQFGSPVEMARFALSKVKRRKAPPTLAPSAVPDRLRPRLDALRPSRREATTES